MFPGFVSQDEEGWGEDPVEGEQGLFWNSLYVPSR